MRMVRAHARVTLLGLAAAAALLAGAACASHARSVVPPGTTEPDKFLFERGTTALNDKKWFTAREFFKSLVETYTQSPYRPDAKLGLADTYLGENTAESLVLAQNEYTEFLSFYPTNARAPYAQYKLGMTHFKQMRAPQRDQTETREAIKSLQAFIDRYSNTPVQPQREAASKLLPEVQGKLREARDRLSQSDYDVGFFYYRYKVYLGAIDRFKSILKDDPQYTRRDAVYFYLAEALEKGQLEAEALPYYERLVSEFEKSEFLEKARLRISEIKAKQAAQSK
jgi:outer membrane protein assembly factor BamD